MTLVVGVPRRVVSARYRYLISVCHANKSDIKNQEEQSVKKIREEMPTHASSNDLMAFLIPSAPSASVPYGSLDEPEILLSSDTRSDSSLLKAEEENKRKRCQWCIRWMRIRGRGLRTGVRRTYAKCARLLGSCS